MLLNLHDFSSKLIDSLWLITFRYYVLICPELLVIPNLLLVVVQLPIRDG